MTSTDRRGSAMGVVPDTRRIDTVDPLAGGGALNADHTLSLRITGTLEMVGGALSVAAAATAALNVVVGDSGSGGTKGLVPAPAAGDGKNGKCLRADGT